MDAISTSTIVAWTSEKRKMTNDFANQCHRFMLGSDSSPAADTTTSPRCSGFAYSISAALSMSPHSNCISALCRSHDFNTRKGHTEDTKKPQNGSSRMYVPSAATIAMMFMARPMTPTGSSSVL